MKSEAAQQDIQDAESLLRRAIDASISGDASSAIAILSEAVSRPDRTGTAHFLLASEYAQMQMYDQAILEMEKAVALDPVLDIARLQLGLLLLTCARAEPALQVLTPLAESDLNAPLPCFAKGLVQLIRDQFAECLHWLIRGIELNAQNPALNMNMEKIIAQVKRLIAEPDSNLLATTADGTQPDSQHFFISTYTGSKKH